MSDMSFPSAETPAAVRRRLRVGTGHRPTAGLAPGYLQGDLVILPERLAGDFARYCLLNPRPCPVIGVSEPGDPRLPTLGSDLDIRTDLGGYRLFRDGRPAGRLEHLGEVWRDDLVTFMLGCSFSFEAALIRSGIAVRHVDAGRNVPMYVTDIPTRAAGAFAGPMVVSMRGFAPADAIRAVLISGGFRLAHGAPVHLGDPAAIGIADLDRPDFGDPPVLEAGDVPLFWACGVTPQMAIRAAAPDLAITHDPGHMLITDLSAEAAEAASACLRHPL